MGPSSSGGTKQPRINSLQIQSSAYSLPIPLGWGRARVGLNLMYAVGFYSQEVKKQASGGKGGGSQEQITYKYFMTTLLMGICDTATGPIRAINTVYRDQSVFTGLATPETDARDVIVGACLENAGVASAHAGYSGQGAYDGLTNMGAAGYNADAVLGYDTTAYLNASNYQLNDQAGLQNHSVEVDFALSAGGDLVDANPGDIVPDFLANCVPQWPQNMIGDLSAYRSYCLAAGLLLSPCLDTQAQASDFIDEIMNETNSACWIRGDGTLQIMPLADAPITGNGVTFMPDLTPIYDLGDDDFIVDNPGDDPIKIDTENLDDLYNVVQVQFKNRQHQYNDETVTANDQASVDEFGQRKRDPDSFPNIKDPTVARLVAQLWVQKCANFARPFTFMLPFGVFDRLEEMDLVTVSNDSMGLDRVLVRIQEIDEDEDTGKLTIKALEVLVGTANAPLYQSQSAGGTITDFEADPGDVAAPVLFLLPTTITNGALVAAAAVGSTNPDWGGCQVWVSLTGDSYKMVGTISGGARYGVTTGSGDLTTDGTSVEVDLSISAGQLSAGSATDAASFVTLCWLGGELIAYEGADLIGTNTYDLTGLQRGGYQTPVADHPIGTSFVRLDDSVFQYPFQSAQIGQTLYIKFASFNIFGKQLQSLDSVTEYTLALTQPDILPGAVTGLTLQSPWQSLQFTLACSAAANALFYTFRLSLTDGTLVHESNATASQSFTYTQDMALADGHLSRTYVATVTPSNSSGDGSTSAPLTVSNPAPAAVTGVTSVGSGGSVTIKWNANTEADFAGYVAYYAQSSGFDPTSGSGAEFYEGQGNSASLSGLTTGQTYYVRVAAFDTWSDDVTELNFSAEYSFKA